MKSAIVISIVSSLAVLICSSSIPRRQATDTTPSSINSTPTRIHTSASMTGTPATQPSFAPGNKNNGVSSVVVETVLAVVIGAVVGLGLLLATAWILWRISGGKKQVEVENENGGKAEYETDGESIFTEVGKDKEK